MPKRQYKDTNTQVVMICNLSQMDQSENSWFTQEEEKADSETKNRITKTFKHIYRISYLAAV